MDQGNGGGACLYVACYWGAKRVCHRYISMESTLFWAACSSCARAWHRPRGEGRHTRPCITTTGTQQPLNSPFQHAAARGITAGPPSARVVTLLTLVTTQSSTSPLKGRNVTHPKLTLNVARPLPSDLILPCVTLLIAVTHTM